MCFQNISSMVAALLTCLLLAPSLTAALNNNDQMNAKVNLGTFEDPSVNVRPRFRYWVPDASVSADVVTSDIQAAVERGCGGVELLGYYSYGARTALPLAESDWATENWGSPAWNALQDAAVQGTQDAEAIIDLALGPNQGSGVPAIYSSPGLQVDIRPYSLNISVGATYAGLLPGWGAGDLVAATTGVLTSFYVPPTYPPPSVGTLDAASLVDITGQIGKNGSITYSCPATTKGLKCVIFGFYLFYTNYVELTSPLTVPHGVPQSAPTSYLQNGTFVWDHFSTEGAQVAIDFWNLYELTSGTSKILKKNGEYLWEDSQEFRPTYAWWTPSLPSLFEANRGYSINKWLPAIVVGYGGHNPAVIYNTNEADAGLGHLQDYRQTLTDANAVYLKTMTAWAQSRGVQYSAQVGYNLPVDMPALVPLVNGPELESLGFSSNIDGYRQFVGAADLAGKRVVSSELGAVPTFVYQQTIPYLLWDIKRSFAAGVRAYVFHGYPYSGSYLNTTWPGFTTFSYTYSDMHGPRQPAWDYYKDSFIDYTGRNMWIQQSGFSKVDLAFYFKNPRPGTSLTTTGTYYTGPSYVGNDLNAVGYTYQYLSPDNFDLKAAHVSGKMLAPSRQAFQALVVRANDTMTTYGVQRLAQFAHNGLPIIFTGGLPGINFWGYNASGAAYVNETLAALTKLKNVYTVPYNNLAASIEAIGITPRAHISANGTWYLRWVEAIKSPVTYVYVYNDASYPVSGGGYATGNITFQTTGAPMLYNAWTGTMTPITVFTQSSSSITIPFALAGNQTVIVAFLQDQTASPSTSSTPPNSFSVSPIITSNGRSSYTVQSQADIPPLTLGPWNLTIESWTAPANLYNGSTVAKNLSFITLNSLTAWRAIPTANLTHISGRGFYTTTFNWPPSNGTSATGAIIDLGAIVHTAQLWVNGQQLPPLDLTWARADIGSYLVKGTNTVEVVVTTPLGNALALVWTQLRTAGQNAAVGNTPGLADYGLVRNVVISPYTIDTYYL